MDPLIMYYIPCIYILRSTIFDSHYPVITCGMIATELAVALTLRQSLYLVCCYYCRAAIWRRQHHGGKRHMPAWWHIFDYGNWLTIILVWFDDDVFLMRAASLDEDGIDLAMPFIRMARPFTWHCDLGRYHLFYDCIDLMMTFDVTMALIDIYVAMTLLRRWHVLTLAFFRRWRLFDDDNCFDDGTIFSPRVSKVRHQEHSMAVDFWGLGVLIYELSHGTSPFQGDLLQKYSWTSISNTCTFWKLLFWVGLKFSSVKRDVSEIISVLIER